MSEETERIVVAGDVTIDWIYREEKPSDDKLSKGQLPPNWKLHTRFKKIPLQGGALLLADMVSSAIKEKRKKKLITKKVKIISQKNDMNGDETFLRSISPLDCIHSNVKIKGYQLSREIDDCYVYRVQKLNGFSGPDKGKVKTCKINGNSKNASIVVIDDAGNTFRETSTIWPASLSCKDTIIIYKMSRPLASGDLWDRISKEHPEKLVIVINADDLRDYYMNISRKLSWESIAQDFVLQMEKNKDDKIIGQIYRSRNVIIRFSIDGAIHYSNIDGHPTSKLYYDPDYTEGSYKETIEGDMQGFTNVFVGALTANIVHYKDTGGIDKGIKEGIEEGIKEGVRASRRFLIAGFNLVDNEPRYPFNEIYSDVVPGRLGNNQKIASLWKAGNIWPVPIPERNRLHGWTILKYLTESKGNNLTNEMVIEGMDKALDKVPVGRFGKLQTIDRVEIESYQCIKNLIKEYIKIKNPKKPLSIAVFGPPGSGKTFGVTQLANSIAKDEIKQIKFNLSQFQDEKDLISAFHRVQDIVLEGKIPLVFFDEFDCQKDIKLGWLKYFLAPMQDSKFKHGEAMHPIGKSIFVFAGGTRDTYLEFCSDDKFLKLKKRDKKERDALKQEFGDAKGPDFVSRLRGYVDVIGLNSNGQNDHLFKVRRAIHIRRILKEWAPGIFDNDGKARIDDNVLNALLGIDEYKHGVRSMEAIIEMSMLSDRNRFGRTALPPEEQLMLHVDVKQFLDLLDGIAPEKPKPLKLPVKGARIASKQLKPVYADYRRKGPK